MSRIKEFYNRYLSWINVYLLVIIGFVAFMFFAGDSSLYNRYLYEEKINQLEKEIQLYEDEIEDNKQKLQDLKTDKEGLERFAREEYKMKKADEDIYLIKRKQ